MGGIKKAIKGIYGAILFVILVLIFIVIPLTTDVFGFGNTDSDTDFSTDWKMADGSKYNLKDLQVSEHGGRIEIWRLLPKDIGTLDALCFESQNVSVKVWINDNLVYDFISKENLTGAGYGVTFHEVGLDKSYEGQTVKIAYERLYEKQTSGYIMDAEICSASYYIRKHLRRVMLPASFCVLTIFFGIFMIVIYVGMANKEMITLNILALGVTAIILGFWLLLDTNIMQLLTGSLYIWRDMSRILPFVVGYPLISFFNSVTNTKRGIYLHISFWVSVSFALLLIFLRYIFQIDMIYSFSRFLMTYIIVMGAMMGIIVFDNYIYSKMQGLESRLKVFYLGLVGFLLFGLLDLVIYFGKVQFSDANGTFTRIGMTFFVVLMLHTIFRWWTADHAEIERDRFINRALQYAVSSDSPEANIEAMLEFMGNELGAGRVAIFENQKNGNYRGNYEWHAEGKNDGSVELIHLPEEGFVDVLYDYYERKGKRLIIDNPKYFEMVSPSLYNHLKSNGISNLIAEFLEINGNPMGILGVVDAPPESLEKIADILKPSSYFLAQLILQREEQKRLFYYNYNDALSGARNHMAYRKYLKDGLDTSSAFGYVRLDIIGLEDANEQYGYEVGDQMVMTTGVCLMEVFGEENVYRINGNSFISFGFETEEMFFDNDVGRAKKLVSEKGVHARVGAVYCLYGISDVSIVIKRAEELLKEDSALI